MYIDEDYATCSKHKIIGIKDPGPSYPTIFIKKFENFQSTTIPPIIIQQWLYW